MLVPYPVVLIQFSMTQTQTVSFIYSSDSAPEPFRVAVRTASGQPGRFVVAAALVTDGVIADVCSSLPLRAGEEDHFTFNSVKLKELPFAASLILFVWQVDVEADAFKGRATFPIFNESGVLMAGRRAVFLVKDENAPPCGPAQFIDTLNAVWRVPSDWHRSSNECSGDLDLLRGDRFQPSLDKDPRFISLTLPSINGVPVIFSEGRAAKSNGSARRRYSPEKVASDEPTMQVNWLVAGAALPVETSITVPLSRLKRPNLWLHPLHFVEQDVFKEHPAALKASRLSRKAGVRLSAKPTGPPPRPSADELRRITEVISQPHRLLSVEERGLMLHFAWSLTDRRPALVKVLQAIDWTDPQECTSALNLFPEWAPLDIDDALALLGRDFSTCPEAVRAYAVKRLEASASPEDLRLYLLQLVQALRFDNPEGSLIGERPLAKFLVERATKDEALATQLFWYVQAEEQDDERGLFSKAAHFFWLELGKTSKGIEIRKQLEVQCAFRRRLAAISQDIASRRADRSEKKTERLRALLKDGAKGAQADEFFLDVHDLTTRFPIKAPLSLDPRISIVRVDPTLSFCAKSALSPVVLACEVERRDETTGGLTTEMRRYMYKTGDDLRQDQLIIQLISLMDTIFKRYGLDLRLTPYAVLATSKDDGYIEFVQDSQSLSAVLASHGDNLLDFFRTVNPSPGGFCGIDPRVLDTFSRSCAGYCVITYVLGIGDRHLDNLLLTTDGRLFHVDFGYILGRDPKPFPPPMKLCREMVDGMGGANSPYYKSFVSKCCQAYSILRRHAKLLISLLRLAADANIKDMKEQDPEVAILKVQQKLQPEASDAKAEQDFIALINESTSALFPVVIERLHKWALYWR